MSKARLDVLCMYTRMTLIVFIVAFCLVATTAQTAFAELTGGALAIQSSVSTQDSTSTQLSASMVDITDLKPTVATSGLTVSLVDGSTTLTSGTNYTYTAPSTAANTENGKTLTFVGKDAYAGKITVNYKIEVEGTPAEDCDVFGANYVEVRYNKNDGFSVALSAAARNHTDDITVPSASTELSGELVLVGKGNYSSQSIKVTYSISVAKVITENMVSAVPSSDGKSLSVSVTDGSTQLVKDTDYTLADLTPTGADDAGEPFHVCVEGKGDWAGTVEYYCVIDSSGGSNTVVQKKYFPGCTVTLDKKTFVHNGEAQKPSSVTVTDGATTLTEGSDYEITWPMEGTVDVGTYNVAVVGKGDYRGKVTVAYTIKVQSSELIVELADSHKSFAYTGSSRQPSWASYESTSYSGVYVMEGEESTATKKYLVKDTDYTVEISPSSTVNVGTYTVTVTGIGDYAEAGSVQETYEITPATLAITSSYFSDYKSYPSTYYYTGAVIEPTLSSVYVGSKSLTKGVDYDVEYLNNDNVAASTDVNAPTMILIGKGNYTGEDYVKFTIAACPLTSSYITCTYDTVTYNGKAQTPDPKSVKITATGVELVKGRDYTVDTSGYKNNVNASTYYTKATGAIAAKGNKFSGSMSTSFTISKKDINSSDIVVSRPSNQTYTGSAISPTITIRDAKTGKTFSSQPSYYSTYYEYEYLTSGSYYSAEYSNNTNPGLATITLTGMSNYTGTRTVTFNITGTGMCPIVKATNKGGGKVVLKWNPIYKATKYMIQEKMPNGSYKTLSSNCQSTACTISNLSVTRKHRFLVRAYVNGKWSSNSDVYLVSIKPTGASKPTARGFSASKTSVTVSWNSVPGADCYAIYQKSGSSYRALTSSYTYTSVHLTQLKKKGKYTYYIRAYVDGKWTGKSNKVTISPADPNPPVVTAVGGVGKGKVKLTWTKARNAKKYMVQVRLANGKWKTLTKNCKKRTYTAKGLTASRSHTFRVRAYGNGKWSKVYSDYNVSATPDNA